MDSGGYCRFHVESDSGRVGLSIEILGSNPGGEDICQVWSVVDEAGHIIWCLARGTRLQPLCVVNWILMPWRTGERRPELCGLSVFMILFAYESTNDPMEKMCGCFRQAKVKRIGSSCIGAHSVISAVCS